MVKRFLDGKREAFVRNQQMAFARRNGISQRLNSRMSLITIHDALDARSMPMSLKRNFMSSQTSFLAAGFLNRYDG